MKLYFYAFACLILFLMPAKADDYQTDSGNAVRVEVTAEVYTEQSFFETTGRALTDCQDPYNDDENCNLVIYEPVEE